MEVEKDCRAKVSQMKRWVVKIGSAVLTNNGFGIDKEKVGNWALQIGWLQSQGVEIVIVSSGAVAAGMQRLGIRTRPTLIKELQSMAAVGQMGLVQTYANQFKTINVETAQILLTHADLKSRDRYLNAKNTIETLLGSKVIPIINENDSVATDEIRFGDNDTLAAYTANLIRADLLVILTDQLGLFNDNPTENPNAELITNDSANNVKLINIAKKKPGKFGSGGMYTKVIGAQIAARSGTCTLIASGDEKNLFRRIYDGEEIGTLLQASQTSMAARKNWMVNHLNPMGKLLIDAGAEQAIVNHGTSLLAVGVIDAQGEFLSGDMVECVNQSGEKIACGLINYNFEECKKIIKQPSDQIKNILGYATDQSLIHRDNLVIVK